MHASLGIHGLMSFSLVYSKMAIEAEPLLPTLPVSIVEQFYIEAGEESSKGQ